MSSHIKRRSREGRGLGLLLVVLGALFLLMGPPLGFWSFVWPFFVMAPGLLLFYLVKQFGKRTNILTIPATMITAVGLLLLLSNTFGLWASWAYAWALIFPGSFGLGLAVYGDLARKPSAERWGENLATVGVGIFLLGFILNAFFAVGGFLGGLLGVFALPLLLIVAGIYLLRRKSKPKGSSYLGGDRHKELSDKPTHIETPLFNEERERV
ncbi:MAG: hypothetical protein M3220_18495 [Chloroflexota bacterium]|nr:hypothetical protein [Chloroflexota bacterium]